MLKELREAKSQLAEPVELLRMVATKHNVTPYDLVGRSRKKEIVVARHEAMFFLRTSANLSEEKIGKILGGRGHSTVSHALKKYNQQGANEGHPATESLKKDQKFDAVDCPACDGSGFLNGETCERCGGFGYAWLKSDERHKRGIPLFATPKTHEEKHAKE